MIQRIQTIFLVIAALALGAVFLLPFASTETPDMGFMSDSRFDVRDDMTLLGLTSVGLLCLIFAIFSFNNRKRQRVIIWLSIVIALALPVLAYLLFTGNSTMAFPGPQVHIQAGLYLPVIVIVMCLAANYYIRKDDKLVKSMDRLR